MSRTKLISTMENNKKINNVLLGVNANSDEGAGIFEFLFNKSLGNEKQYTSENDNNLVLLAGLNPLLGLEQAADTYVNTVNDINSSYLNEENTYTLDDLLNLDAVVPDSVATDGFVFDDTLNNTGLFEVCPTIDVSLEMPIDSPLSSSSEESCDLNELLQLDANTPLSVSSEAIEPVQSHLNDVSADPIDPCLENMETSVLSDDCGISFSSEDISSTGDDLLTQLGIEPTPLTNSEDEQMSLNADLNAMLALLQSQADASTSLVLSNIEPPVIEESTSSSDESEIRYSPYSKGKKKRTPEQKTRKKAQNRTAALRYRSKKKDEFKQMCEEADELEGKNKELRGKVEGLRTEIDYLKNLMLDVIKARLAKGNTNTDLIVSLLAGI